MGALEIATAFAVAVLFVWSCSNIRVDPLVWMGKVSGIAAVELRLLWFGLPLLVALVLAAKLRGGRAFPIASRFVCAAFAGLSSAAVAGGILAVLYRTPYGLGGVGGDTGVLITWADELKRGVAVSPLYPPLQTYLLAWISDFFDMPTAYAMKWFQIAGITVVGPFAYATWRLLLPPGWALGVGVVASLPLIEAYRQYPLLVLVVLVPLLVKFLDVLRRSPELAVDKVVQYAVLFGIALGALFLLYSGWFSWSAPGFMVATLIVFPWRRRWHRGALFCGIALVVLLLMSFQYLRGVLDDLPIRDDYVDFDATIQPAYIAMWRGGLPGELGVWPPMGELAGVGLYTVLLAIGVGVAVAFGRSHSLVLAVGPIMAGTWLLRFWHAKNMYQTKLVQLFPRTTAELHYCALIFTLFAIHLLIERARARADNESPLRKPSALIGACAGFLFLIIATTGATTDRYMPKERSDDPGHMAWLALRTPPLDQSQARYARPVVSSYSDEDGYSVRALVDRNYTTAWSSEVGDAQDREEWVELWLPAITNFSSIVLHPASDGFPVDFVVELWDSQKWVPSIERTAHPQPQEPQAFAFGRLERTNGIRVRATKLRHVGTGYALRMAEIELRR